MAEFENKGEAVAALKELAERLSLQSAALQTIVESGSTWAERDDDGCDIELFLAQSALTALENCLAELDQIK